MNSLSSGFLNELLIAPQSIQSSDNDGIRMNSSFNLARLALVEVDAQVFLSLVYSAELTPDKSPWSGSKDVKYVPRVLKRRFSRRPTTCIQNASRLPRRALRGQRPAFLLPHREIILIFSFSRGIMKISFDCRKSDKPGLQTVFHAYVFAHKS